MHPMNSIDDKAKHEVQELLQDLVVSPVSKKIGEEITELSESLSKLQDVHNKFNVLGGIIENKISKISKKLDSLDEVSDNIDSLETNFLKNIKAKTDKLDDLQSKVIDPLSRLTESINELKTIKEPILNIEKEIDVKFKKVSDDINACQSLCKEINKTLSNEIQSLCNGISISLENKNSEVSEEHNRQYQQNRTSFLILISLSVINLLGLIGLIIIHVIH